MIAPLFLIANPGSASRKYALFEGTTHLAKLHFEHSDGRIVCTLEYEGGRKQIPTEITRLDDALGQVIPILNAQQLLNEDRQIEAIGLRIVAPGSYFLSNHVVDDNFLGRLQAAYDRAPLHIAATLTELKHLRNQFPRTQIIGVSDSAFHITKPEHAWNYGIPLETADMHDIKRFGYHGLSVASVIRQAPLPPKIIICHLGSGASITAVHAEKSVDTTMGFSPLEGLVMATRSGSIDASAVSVLRQVERLSDHDLEIYLNERSGLLGLGGSSDIRELLERENSGDPRSTLALATFIYSIQKGIGAMAAALEGADALIFTGTIGERSDVLRWRVVAKLSYLGFRLDPIANNVQGPNTPKQVHALNSKPIFVVPAREEQEIAHQMLTIHTI